MSPKHVAFALLLSGIALAGTASRWRSGEDSRPPRDLVLRSLDARQRGDLEGSHTLLRDAWAADPQDFFPLIELAFLADDMGRAPRLWRSLDSIALRHGDSLLLRCVRKLLTREYTARVPAEVRRSGLPITRRCGDLMIEIRDDARNARLWRKYPFSPPLFDAQLTVLANENPAGAWELARSTARGSAHPMIRVTAYASGSYLLHRLGRHREALAWEREGEERARSWGAGALFRILSSHYNHVSMLGQVDADDSVSLHAHQTAGHARRELAALAPRLDVRGRSHILYQQGVDMQATGRFRESLDALDRLIALADSVGATQLEAYGRARRGRTLVKLGQLDDAKRDLEQARALALKAEALTAMREVAHDLLHLYEAKGEHAQAIQSGRDFARYSDSVGSMPTRMMAHHDLGWLYRRMGRVADAEYAFRRMIADVDTLGRFHFWAGEYFEHSGHLERASEYYRRALIEPQDRARALAGLVRTNEALGDLEEARRYAHLADRDSGAWHPEYSALVPGLLARHANGVEARKHFRLARAAAARRGQMQGFAQLALESAELELKLQQPAVARVLADSAASAAAVLGASEIEVRARATSAFATLTMEGARRSAGATAAAAALDSATRRGNTMRIPQLSAGLHLIRGDALLRSKAPLEAMRSYARAADWVDSTAARIVEDPSRAGYRTTHIGVSNRALAGLLRDSSFADRIVRYVSWTARRKGGFGRAPARSPWKLPRSDEAIIDYVVLDSTVAALVVTRADATILDLAIDPDTLRAWIARFRAPIAPRIGSAIDVAHLGFDDEVAHQLYRSLIAPVLPRLGGRTELIVVPDGPLHMLPFDALVASRGAPRRYLLDDLTIRYATGLDAIEASRGAAAFRNASLLALAGPSGHAAGASDEIAAIARSFGGELRVLESSRATKRRVLQEANGQRTRVIHFATHGEANDVNPDLARLALERDSTDDGWLHAFEVRTLRLDGALVVLSACETAGGRVAAGEGTLSLSRAFLRAGAVGTIATLWPIGAPTSVLMETFYRELSTGASAASALRVARQRLRAAGYDHPFYWAPFVLTTRRR